MYMQVRNIELTPELTAKLRSFSPIKPDETFPYTPAVWRDESIPKELRPEFILRPLSGIEALESGDDMRGTVKYDKDGQSEMLFNHGKYVLSVCRKGIVGWSNYIDIETGKEIKYENSLKCLPQDLLRELSNTILSRGRLTEEEIAGLK